MGWHGPRGDCGCCDEVPACELIWEIEDAIVCAGGGSCYGVDFTPTNGTYITSASSLLVLVDCPGDDDHTARLEFGCGPGEWFAEFYYFLNAAPFTEIGRLQYSGQTGSFTTTQDGSVIQHCGSGCGGMDLKHTFTFKLNGVIQ